MKNGLIVTPILLGRLSFSFPIEIIKPFEFEIDCGPPSARFS